jgi:hypothetical protein
MHILQQLDAEVRAEVAKHGGNPLLEGVLDDLMSLKNETYKKK